MGIYVDDLHVDGGNTDPRDDMACDMRVGCGIEVLCVLVGGLSVSRVCGLFAS